MPTPDKATALEQLKDLMLSIQTTSGYNSNVVTSEKVLRDIGDVPSGLRPWIGIMPGEETVEHYAFNCLRMSLQVLIWAHTASSTKADALTATINLEDDIMEAIKSDHTLGGYCTDLRVLSVEDDVGNPDVADSNGYSGSIWVKALMVYHRTT